MSLSSGSLFWRGEGDRMLSDLENDVFLPDEDERKDDQEVLLGSRLEEELNRSIEKMRELEKSGSLEDTRLETLVSSGGVESSEGKHSRLSSAFSLSCKEELLEDIEMPILSSSSSECAELVSFSSGSPNSPMKQSRFSERFDSSSREPVKKGLKPRESEFVVPAVPPSGKRDADLAEKIAELSVPLAMKVTTLVSMNENESTSPEGALQSLDVEADDLKETKNKSCNLTLSPLSSSYQTSSFSILDIDKLDDNLLSSILAAPFDEIQGSQQDLATSFTDAFKASLENSGDIQEMIKKLLAGKQSKMTDKCGAENAADTTSVVSPTRRMTLGAMSDVLDMDKLDDNLLSSILAAPSDEIQNQQDLATSFTDAFKKVLSKKMECGDTGRNDDKPGDDSLHLVGQLLNEIQSVVDKPRSVNNKPKDLEKVCSLGETFSTIEKLVSNAEGTFSQQGAVPKALNSTFDSKALSSAISACKIPSHRKGSKANPNTDATFRKFEELVSNETFCAKGIASANATFDSKGMKIADVTFDAKGVECVDSTFHVKGNQPITCQEEEGNLNLAEAACNDKDEEEGKGEKLNVTFERGEYRIGPLNETVNLMDAEGDVLKLILDSTPQKPLKAPTPGAASTPLSSARADSATKRTVTKDPTQSFLHRMSLGMRRSTQTAAEDKEQQAASLGQPPSLGATVPGLKIGCIGQQSIPNQFRRHNNGPSGRAGPMRALPIAGMSVGNSSDKVQKDIDTPDGLDGIKALDNNTPSESDLGNQVQGLGGIRLPSFGSFSSIENERPSTPDLFPARGIMTSTPDMFRPGSHKMSPRITSTPATRIGAFSNVIAMDGPAPTPITVPSSRSRFSTVNSTSSVPEGQLTGNPTWEGSSKDSAKDCKGSLDTLAKSSQGMLAKPVEPHLQVNCAEAAISEQEPQKYHQQRATSYDEDIDLAGIERIEIENVESPLDANVFNACLKESQMGRLPVENLGGEEIEAVAETLEVDGNLGRITKQNDLPSDTDTNITSNNKEKLDNMTMEEVQADIDVKKHQEELNQFVIKEGDDGETKKGEPESPKESNEKLHVEGGQAMSEVDVPLESETVDKNELQSAESETVIYDAGQNVNKDPGHLDLGDEGMLPTVLEGSITSEVVHLQTDEIALEVKPSQGERCGVSVSTLNIGNSECKSSAGGIDCIVDCASKTEQVKEITITLNQSKKVQLDATHCIEEDKITVNDRIKHSPAAVKVNERAVKREPSALENTLETAENKMPLMRKKMNSNKENIGSAKKDSKSSQPKINTRNQNLVPKGKLPSQRLSLRPSNSQNNKQTPEVREKKTESSKGSNILKVNNTLQKLDVVPPHKPNVRAQVRSPMVRKAVNVSPLKQSGLKAPSTKLKEVGAVPIVEKGTRKLQVPMRSSLQPPSSSKLPMAPRSNSGIPMKGLVRSQSVKEPSQAKNPMSRLPGLRPPTSKLPALPTQAANKTYISGGGAVPSLANKQVKLKRP